MKVLNFVVQSACHVNQLNDNSKSKILSVINVESQDTILKVKHCDKPNSQDQGVFGKPNSD